MPNACVISAFLFVYNTRPLLWRQAFIATLNWLSKPNGKPTWTAVVIRHRNRPFSTDFLLANQDARCTFLCLAFWAFPIRVPVQIKQKYLYHSFNMVIKKHPMEGTRYTNNEPSQKHWKITICMIQVIGFAINTCCRCGGTLRI